MNERSVPPIHPAELLRRVCDAYLVDRRDVLSYCRDKDVREARQLLYLLLYERCSWPVRLIGHKLHRDHSTVCHGIARDSAGARAHRDAWRCSALRASDRDATGCGRLEIARSSMQGVVTFRADDGITGRKDVQDVP